MKRRFLGEIDSTVRGEKTIQRAQWVSQSINQSINQSIKRTINQSINQEDDQSIKQSNNQLRDQSIERPIDQIQHTWENDGKNYTSPATGKKIAEYSEPSA